MIRKWAPGFNDVVGDKAEVEMNYYSNYVELHSLIILKVSKY